ncbi:MAG: succinate--CoA ligase subunit beta, partial [Gammaproteobacteria bacterium]
MHLHEYQAKQLFAEFGIPVPAGRVITRGEELDDIDAGAASRVVKAQIHAGGRGKGGGVRRVSNRNELAAAVEALLGSRLVTRQTDATGLPVNSVLVEQTVDIAREIYFSILVDRGRERVMLMTSAAGGMNIEEVAAADPAAILTEIVNPAVGLQGYQ